jgi:mRNA interferase MazF
VLLAMITTAKRSSWPLDWPILDLSPTGLNAPCCVRLKLFSLDERLILGRLGQLAGVDRDGVQANLQRLMAHEENQPLALALIRILGRDAERSFRHDCP